MGSRLFRQGGVYVFSSWVSQAVMLGTWLILPWKLAPAEVGVFALLTFVCEIATRLMLLGVDTAILRFYVEPRVRSQYFSAATLWAVGGLVLAAGVMMITQPLVSRLIPGLGTRYAEYMWLVFATAAANAFAATAFSHYIASGLPRPFAKLTLLKSGVTAAGMLGSAWGGFGATGLMTAQLVAGAAVYGYFLLGGNRSEKWSAVDRETLRNVGRYGTPMTFYALFAIGADYAGRLFLDRHVSLAELGVFQFFYQIAVQVTGVWASLNRAWTPYFFQRVTEDAPAAFQILTRLSAAATAIYAISLAALALLGAAGGLNKIFPPEFSARTDLFHMLLLGPLFHCIYTAVYPVFFSGRSTFKISIVQCLVSVITIGITLWLTLRFQAWGASAAWVLGIAMTPAWYVLAHPAHFAALRGVLTTLLIWCVAGTGVAASLSLLDSQLAAAMCLLLGAVVVAFLHCRRDIEKLRLLFSRSGHAAANLP